MEKVHMENKSQFYSLFIGGKDLAAAQSINGLVTRSLSP